MTTLYHLAERSQWEAARRTGSYEISTRGRTLADEGFIHCSLRHQVRGVASAFYADVDDLVLLVIDPSRVTSPVVYEPPAPGAEDFPHIYGPLPVEAVVSALPVERDANGAFVLPE